MTDPLADAPGASLAALLAPAARAAELKQASCDWPSWDLTARQLCDLELLLSGGFAPLRGFLGRRDYESVRDGLRLADGTLWPVPITLDVTAERAADLGPGSRLVLRDPEGLMLAVLTVDEMWEPDRGLEARRVLGTDSPEHPEAARLLEHAHPVYVGGTVEGIALPPHPDFGDLRETPAQTRAAFARLGWKRVAAYRTGGLIHRAQHELTLEAARRIGGGVLVHALMGPAPHALDPYTRVRCHRAVMHRYPAGTARLALVEQARRWAGPREAVLDALVSGAYGCTHLVVGADHGSPDVSGGRRAFYPPYEAHALLAEHRDDLGVEVVGFRRIAYVERTGRFTADDEAPADAASALSGPELRSRLERGVELPEWLTVPEVAHELTRRYPPRSLQGFTVFFTGYSGSGKSTVARVLQHRLLELGGRSVSFLDGDLVRRHLSSELGFSRAHRDLNVRRIGFVAAEITKAGGIAICAPIAPYDRVRKENRRLVSAGGGYVLVHVATPLDVCERRDRKGLYAKARAGLIREFTGISDPYESPDDADVVIDTTTITPEEAAERILLHLRREGYLGPSVA